MRKKSSYSSRCSIRRITSITAIQLQQPCRNVHCVTLAFAEWFANMSTKITTRREFRLGLSFLLRKNNQRVSHPLASSKLHIPLPPHAFQSVATEVQSSRLPLYYNLLFGGSVHSGCYHYLVCQLLLLRQPCFVFVNKFAERKLK